MTDLAALEALARRIAEDAHAGQVDKADEPVWHIIAPGFAYIDPDTVDCCGARIGDLPDDDMVVHDWPDARRGQVCPQYRRAREALGAEVQA